MKRSIILWCVYAALAVASPAGKPGRVEANGVTIAYESFGPTDRETVLLIAGSAMQLTDWPVELCEELVKRGYRVIIYDNRDIGLSTKFDAAGMPDFAAVVKAAAEGKPAPLPYTLYDMAADAVGLLDALGIKKAHIAGASMGGMIAQIVTANYPDRTLSLISMMASDGKPGLPIVARPERFPQAPPPGPDAGKQAYIQYQIKVRTALAGPRYVPDEKVLAQKISRNVRRSFCMLCEARQGAASLFTALEDRRLKLKAIRVPTIVVHGDEDPLVPLDAGRDVVANIPGAELCIIPGMGHDIPSALVKTVADAITAAAARANRKQ
jgi:pimeloyl-ACP methyl ester carboxylesterase